jgi:hypothetical protein
MQAGAGTVETDISCHAAFQQRRVERCFVGDLMELATRLQEAQEIGAEFGHEWYQIVHIWIELSVARCPNFSKQLD